MMQQDVHNQRRLSGGGKIKMDIIRFKYLFLPEINFNEQMMATSDTMKDANDTLSKSLIL
jgi:hypothetical protein